MTKRKGLSKKLRFTIFARDGFACRYCGRQSDEVKLVVDHLIPVAQGGGNEETNLLTSCEPCNQGKSDRTVAQAAPSETDRLRLAQEFQEQNDLHRKATEALRQSRETRQLIVNSYCEIMGVNEVAKSAVTCYVNFCSEVGPNLLFEWFHIAAGKMPSRSDSDICKYICGIRRNTIKKEDPDAS